MMKGILAGIFLCMTTLSFAQELVVRNDKIQRVLTYDGQVWRTTRFADASGKVILPTQSDEFHILPMHGEKGFTISDFTADGQPVSSRSADTSFVRISYRSKPASKGKPAIPEKLDLRRYKGQRISISYEGKGEFESHLLAERKVKIPAFKPTAKSMLWPITHSTRRETVRLTLGSTTFEKPPLRIQ